ncbi:MAG: PDZ domain-containing protein [Bacteroidota bacterium]
MLPALRIAVLCLVLATPVAAQGTLEVGGDAAVLVFPADSVLVSIGGTEAARVEVRFGPDRGPDLYPGDLVTALNGTPVANGQEARELYRALEAGDEVRLSVERDGTAREVVFAKPARPAGQLAISPTPEQLAAARARQGWGGTSLATAEYADRWVPTNGAAATHDEANGTVLFKGTAPESALRLDEPLDVHRREGLRVRAKGDGGTYRVRLTDAGGASASVPFEASERWGVYDLAFVDFEGDALDLTALAAIELVSEAGPFQVELDAVEPY